MTKKPGAVALISWGTELHGPNCRLKAKLLSHEVFQGDERYVFEIITSYTNECKPFTTISVSRILMDEAQWHLDDDEGWQLHEVVITWL